jgi:hypothetical protein
VFQISRLTFWTRFDAVDESSVVANPQNSPHKESVEMINKGEEKQEKNDNEAENKMKIEEDDVIIEGNYHTGNCMQEIFPRFILLKFGYLGSKFGDPESKFGDPKSNFRLECFHIL